MRGLASLLILDNLMRRINKDNPPKPCEVFDLIGGTNTGGYVLRTTLGIFHKTYLPYF